MPEGNVRTAHSSVSVVRGLEVLASGTVLAQSLIVLVSPILTRLYTPTDFGFFGVFAGLSATLALVGCGSYENAIPYAKNDASADALVRLCFLILPIVTIFISLFVSIEGSSIFSLLNFENRETYAWAIPVCVLLICSFQIGQNATLRSRRYGAFARANVWQSVATAAGQLLFGLLAFPAGIVVGYLVGRLIGAASAMSNVNLRTRITPLPHAPVTARAVAVEYRKFPIYLTWSSLLNQISTLLPVFLLSAFFDPQVAGFLALSQRVLQLPALVVSSAVSKVFISLAHDAHHGGKLLRVTDVLVRTLALVGVPGFCLLALVTPELFGLVFGASWRTAGVYAQWLLPWLAMTFIASPLSAVLPTLQKQQCELAFQVLLILGRSIALGIGIIANDALLSIALFGVTSGVCWIVFMLFSMSLAGHSVKSVAVSIVREILLAVPFLIPVAMIKISTGGSVNDWSVMLSGLLGALFLAIFAGMRLIRMQKNGEFQGLVD